MSEFQLNVLQRDSKELQDYISEVAAKGKTTLASKLTEKLEYLNSRIAEFS